MKVLMIDIETTGLSMADDLLEVGLVLATERLHVIDTFTVVVGATAERLEQMALFVRDMHHGTGLWEDCLTSTVTEEEAHLEALRWLNRQEIDPDEVILAGGAGFDHFDRPFLRAHGWHSFLNRLHYGSLDVSPMRRMLQLVHPDAVIDFDGGGYSRDIEHRALSDAHNALRQAQIYAEVMRLGWDLLVTAEKALGPRKDVS